MSNDNLDSSKSNWEPLVSMNKKRYGAACAAVDEHRFVVIGGRRAITSYDHLPSSEIYDDQTQQWSDLPNPLPNARVYCGAASSEEKIYVVGGIDSLAESTSELSELDTRTWKWQQLPSMKQPRWACASVAVGGFIYVFGGIGSTKQKDPRLDSAERYNINTKKWEDLPRMPTKRTAFSAVAVENKIYIIGGYNGEKWLASVQVFDIQSQTWHDTPVPDMPTARSGCAAVAVGFLIVVTGGRENMNNNLSSVEVLDTTKNQWKTLSKISVPRYRHLAAALDNGVVVAGGYDGTDLLESAEKIARSELLPYAPPGG